MSPGERFWPNRLAWRLRGGLQWPAFVVTTLVDAADSRRAAARSPRSDLNFFDGVLIATFGNLFLLGAVAPFLAKRLMRRRALTAPAGATTPPPEAQREVLQDRVAALAMAAGVVACLVSGLANRPLIVSETNATEEAARQMELFVNHSGSAELRRNDEAADTAQARRRLLPGLRAARRPPPVRVHLRGHEQGPGAGPPRPEQRVERRSWSGPSR